MKQFLNLKSLRGVFVLGLAIAMTLISSTTVQGQTKQNLISIKLREVKLIDALKEVNSKSGNQVLYKVEEVSRETKLITVDLKNVSVKESVHAILDGTGFDYAMRDNGVVVFKKVPTQQPQKPETRTISGVVTDIAGKPLEGIAVMVKGTTIGMATDNKGCYTLKIPESAILTFYCLGMKPREIGFRGQKEINVIMEDDAADMNEVVVTGVFNKAKESYTGSVTTVTSREIQAFRGQNLLQTLKNIDPAFNITVDNELGSNPNAIPQINIRGNSSLPMSVEEYNAGLKTNVNTPLIIMDGFEISLTRLMDFNDEDIESINILKDASATAIYGSRGANGVIVVVTKAPQAGKLLISAQAALSVEVPNLASYNLLNAREMFDLQYKSGLYSSGNPNSIQDPMIFKENADLSYEMRHKDILEGVNTDWLHYPIRTGISGRYNLRLEGGNQEFRWGTTLSFSSNAGVMKGSNRDNFNAGFSLSYTYKNVIFKNQLRVGISSGNESPYGSFGDYAKMMPYYRPFNDDGTLVKDFMGLFVNHTRVRNPLNDAFLTSRNESGYNDLTNNFSIEWNIIKNLTLRTQFGVTKKNSATHNYLSPEHSTFTYYSGTNFFRKGIYRYGVGDDFSYEGDVVLSYSKTFKDKHQLYTGLNYSIQDAQSYLYNFVLEGFTKASKPFLGNASRYEENGIPRGTESTTRRLGVTANLNYTYDNRYFADLSVRTDGSSQFGSNSKFAPFWSLGAGWNLHRENFLKNSRVIDNLRLRTSIGQTGSQQFSSYQALQTYKFFNDDRYLNWIGAQLMALGNPNLKWQMTNQINLGAEVSILNGRVSGSVDYYTKITSDLLSSRELPHSTGYTSYIDNVGEVTNSGVEGSLNTYLFRDTERGFIWMVGTRIAYTKNKISKLSDEIKKQTEQYKEQDVDISTLFYEGYSQNSIWAVKSLGIDPSTGKEYFIGKNGQITDQWDPSAKIYCGVGEPLYRGNISSMLRYKNFTLNLSFGYHWGGVIYNQTLIDKVEVTLTELGRNNVDKRVYSDRWQKPGDVTFYKGLSYNETRATSRFVMKDNTFELQSASLQYRIDRGDLIKKLNIRSLILEANSSDLFYISTVKRERGTNYPFAARAGFSISVTF